jgi:hypothetical protein
MTVESSEGMLVAKFDPAGKVMNYSTGFPTIKDEVSPGRR